MKLAFLIGTLALGFTASAPARADFGIVKFNSEYCRIWPDTAVAPPDGTFIWWVWGLSPLLPPADLGCRRAQA